MSVIRQYTSHAMYDQYLYAARITYVDTDTKRIQKRWLKTNCNEKFRTLNLNSSMSVFFSDAGDHSKFVAENAATLVSITAPANAEHESLLRQGVSVEIRPHLYYHKHRYRVNFRRAWRGCANNLIVLDWVRSAITDSEKRKQDYHINTNDCTLYLMNSDDLMMVKLAMHEYVHKITAVILESELAAN